LFYAVKLLRCTVKPQLGRVSPAYHQSNERTNKTNQPIIKRLAPTNEFAGGAQAKNFVKFTTRMKFIHAVFPGVATFPAG
jgi:hypothetical protein